MAHAYRDVAIVAVHNTPQARQHPGHDSVSLALDATLGLLAQTGLHVGEIDGVAGPLASRLIYALGIGPAWYTLQPGGVTTVLEVANAVASGLATTVLIADGAAENRRKESEVARWTRPENEFVIPFGMFTALEFALVARRHMEAHGTTPEQMAHVSAVIRNNGSVHPDAVYYDRGPFKASDILESPLVADPFRLLDCSTTSEGGTALLITTADRAAQLRSPPVFIMGAAVDRLGPAYHHAPTWDLQGSTDIPNGYIGRRAARHAFAQAGLGPEDVDCCEFYDPFSFEVVRQYEAFGFCKDGEGGEFVVSGAIEPGGQFPVATDGGTMSFGHSGGTTQLLQRVARGVQQLQGNAPGFQVAGAEVAMCSGGGAGALFTDVILLGKERP